MARADKWMEPYGNAINPVTKMPIYGDPATIVGGIGAAGSIIGGLAGASASSDAASAQQQAANDATNAQLQMFNTVNSQQAPYRQAGQTALNALLYGSGLAGLSSGNSSSPGSGLDVTDHGVAGGRDFMYQAAKQRNQLAGYYQMLADGSMFDASAKSDKLIKMGNLAASYVPTSSQSQSSPSVPGIGFGDLTHQFNANDLGTNLSPSYNFMLSQGLGALQNSQAAQGGLVGGNALRGINDYAQNYASTGYQQAFNNYTANQSNIFNRLSDIAGLGQTANQQTAQAASSFAPSIAGTIQGAGQAAASGIVGSTNALTGGLNNALGWYQLGNLGGSPTFGSGGRDTAPGISLASNTPIGNF